MSRPGAATHTEDPSLCRKAICKYHATIILVSSAKWQDLMHQETQDGKPALYDTIKYYHLAMIIFYKFIRLGKLKSTQQFATYLVIYYLENINKEEIKTQIKFYFLSGIEKVNYIEKLKKKEAIISNLKEIYSIKGKASIQLSCHVNINKNKIIQKL